MSAADAPDARLLEERGPERADRAFWQLTRMWLSAPDRGNARLLLAGVLALTAAQVAIQIRFNLWNRDFFNALERRDGVSFRVQILIFLGLAALSMTVSVYHLYVAQLLKLRWREWLTRHLLAAWLRDGRHYQLELAGTKADNPEQRIADDVRAATDLAVEFAAGVLTSVLMLSAFVGILWTISGPMTFALASHDFEIPGYMVWAALAYATVGSTLTYLVGRPMVRLNNARSVAEGDLRFGLTRARESGEGIALIRGEADERRGLAELFAAVTGAVKGLMRSQRNLMWLTSAYTTLAMIFPTIVAAPAYFAGQITLGGLMQIAAAFAQVQIALNWFVDNFPRIAEWRSSVARVVVFLDVIEDLDTLIADTSQPTIGIIDGAPDRLVFRNVEVAFADGTLVIADASAEIHQGERVLIRGESGSGKSTLFRAFAGLWPWGAGEIEIPPRDQMMFMPQRPYLPLGSLRAALSYPRAPDSFDDATLAGALSAVGLKRLAGELDRSDRWDRILSLGEQQRLAFARLLLLEPRWIFMDEATAALDEANQDAMMQLVIDRVPGASWISIGHRPGLDVFHTRTLELVRSEGGAKLTRPKPRHARDRQWSRRSPRAGGRAWYRPWAVRQD